jgi:hypothetical protein
MTMLNTSRKSIHVTADMNTQPGLGLPGKNLQQTGVPGKYLQKKGVPGNYLQEKGVSGEYLQKKGVPGEYLQEKGMPGEYLKEKGMPGGYLKEKGVPHEYLKEKGVPIKAHRSTPGNTSAVKTDVMAFKNSWYINILVHCTNIPEFIKMFIQHTNTRENVQHRNFKAKETKSFAGC